MRKMKLVALMMATALIFTACSKSGDEGKDPTPTVTPTVEATPTVEPTQEPTLEPTQTPEGGDNTGEPSMPATSDELDKVHKAVTDAYGEDYIPNMQYDTTALSELFGVKEEWYDAAIAEGPMISMHVDTFVAVHATEGNLENVQNALNAYRDKLVNDTMQYPMNQLKIQGSKVETVGNYVFFIMLGYLEDETAYDTDDATIAAYTELNQKAIDAINGVIEK